MSSLSLDKFTATGVDPVSREPMTVNGTVIRTAMLLLVSAATGIAGWMFLPASLLLPTLLLGVGGAILFSVLASRQPLNARVPAFAYAAMQGLLIGAVARQYESASSGIVVTALLATAVTVAATLLLFAVGWIRPGRKARSIIGMATLSIFAFYALTLVMSLFGVQMPGIYDTGWLGIGISLLILGVAIANLFSDYSIVLEAIESGTDERFEWFAAFGLTATVLWIFVEFLRLLSRR